MFYSSVFFPFSFSNFVKKIPFRHYCTHSLHFYLQLYHKDKKQDLQGSAAYAGAVSQDTVKITIRPLHILFIVTSEYLFLTDKFQHSHYSTIFLVADIQ